MNQTPDIELASAKMYTLSFYDTMSMFSQNSAEVIVPLVIQKTGCRSVIDVGCGDGSWLAVFQSHGVANIIGVDGDYVARETLKIAPEFFLAADLSQPLKIEKSCDLAISMEVGEHLPAASAKQYVQSLCRLAPVILFSAAVPAQGGVHHINEQWPDYWAGLFAAEDFVTIDNIRPQIWDNEHVAPWYAQNTFMYVNREHLSCYPTLEADSKAGWIGRVRIVHPGLLADKEMMLGKAHTLEEAKLRDLLTIQANILRRLPAAFKNALTFRLGR